MWKPASAKRLWIQTLMGAKIKIILLDNKRDVINGIDILMA